VALVKSKASTAHNLADFELPVMTAIAHRIPPRQVRLTYHPVARRAASWVVPWGYCILRLVSGALVLRANRRGRLRSPIRLLLSGTARRAGRHFAWRPIGLRRGREGGSPGLSG